MGDPGLGAGLAALAFWGFIAAVVVGGMWYSIREREAQHETIRRLIESGQPINQELIDRLEILGGGAGNRPDRDFRITALWISPVAVGMAAMALFLGYAFPETLFPLLGVAALLACLGAGFWIASKIAARWYGGNGSGAGH